MSFHTQKKIRVLIVDDSPLSRRFLHDGLALHPDIEVIGEAFNAMDAERKCLQLKPDVMTLDVEMPGMNGIEFLGKFLPKHPMPVILVSSLNLRVFDALAAGAVDFVRKPEGTLTDPSYFFGSLTNKIIIASTARVRPAGTTAPAAPLPRAATPIIRPHTTPFLSGTSANASTQTIIALGASTGGTEATLEVLRSLPKNTPGIVIVQHMPAGFTKMYAERLDRLCQMYVKEATNGDIIEPGKVLIAPGEYQMRVTRNGNRYAVSCVPGAKVSGHCPSVDVLFSSVASTVKCNKVGIIMTGMGRDGAQGLLEMRRAGAYTIGQDRESCVVYGMPMVANDIGAVCTQASCQNIANVLLRHLSTIH